MVHKYPLTPTNFFNIVQGGWERHWFWLHNIVKRRHLDKHRQWKKNYPSRSIILLLFHERISTRNPTWYCVWDPGRTSHALSTAEFCGIRPSTYIRFKLLIPVRHSERLADHPDTGLPEIFCIPFPATLLSLYFSTPIILFRPWPNPPWT